jgi:outer membrane receptor for ferrienterochelin and colicin
MNKFSTGINFAYDKYEEFVNLFDHSRTDNSLGIFFEYTYDNTSNFSFVLGGRFDNHNRIGAFFTPRLHVRYNTWEKGVFRFSAGRGVRSANIFAENQQLFGSSRNFEILNTNGKFYGLDPEIAWNYGLSFSQKFILFNKNGDFGFDFYRTDFQNQVVVDLYQGPQQVVFYNLNGKSFANSLQIEFNYELVHRFNLRTAYKYYDIQTDYQYVTQERPLQAKHRFFGNLEYQTPLLDDGKQWKFDFTINWFGIQRLPNTISNSGIDSMPDFSPSFSVMNMQITKVFSSTFEVYIGGENIGNYKQEKAILGSEDPFSTAFDTSIIYAPIFGQMYYAGLRFKIK